MWFEKHIIPKRQIVSWVWKYVKNRINWKTIDKNRSVEYNHKLWIKSVQQ